MQNNKPIPIWRGMIWTIVIFGAVTAGIALKIAPLISSAFEPFSRGC
jgi:hypothetical protein